MWYVTGSNFGDGFSRWLARSADLASWEEVEMSDGSSFGQVTRVLRVSDRLIFADDQGYSVYTDDGAAYPTQHIAQLKAIGADAITPAPAIVWLGTNDHFYYSLDNAASITDTGEVLAFVPFIVYVPDGDTWFTAGKNPSFGDVAVQYHDGDPTVSGFFAASFSGGGSSTGRVACYDFDNEYGLLVGAGDVYTTTDGQNFSLLASAPISSGEQIMVRANGLTVLGATSGRLYTSADNSTWSANLAPVGAGTIRDIAFDGTSWLAVDSNRNVLASDDGATWTIAYTFPSGVVLNGCTWLESAEFGFFRYPYYWDQIIRATRGE